MKTWILHLIFGIILMNSQIVSAQVENARAVVKTTKAERERPVRSKGKSPEGKDVKTNVASVEFEHTVWRDIDLNKGRNGVLGLPEDEEDGANLFRVILDALINGNVQAYEFLDGRESFTQAHKVGVDETFERLGLSEDRNIMPTHYYLIENWEFDNRTHQKRRNVEALCPVLEISGELGENIRYPLFWVRYADIKPWLRMNMVSVSDIDSRKTHTLDDFFALSLYDGEIYKTKNPRNLTLGELYNDSVSLSAARDSIERRLNDYGTHLWLPSREEYLAGKGESDAVKNKKSAKGGPSIKASKSTASPKSSKSSKTVKQSKRSEANAGAVKSVRRRRR